MNPAALRRWAWLPLAIALLAGFAYVVARSGPLAPVRVTVATVTEGQVAPELFGIGTVDARRAYAVGPTAPGRLLQVDVDVGDTVRAGQVLYRIHADYPSDLQFARQAVERHCGVSLGTAAQIPQVFVES